MNDIHCTIGSDGRHYYFRNGRRIKNAIGLDSGVECVKKAAKERKHRNVSPKVPVMHVPPPEEKYDNDEPGCINRSNLPLEWYQKEAVNDINSHSSLLLVFEMGMGKTLVAVAASQCYLDKYPDRKIVILSPAGLVDNFKKEMIRYGAVITDNYEFYSFEKFIRMEHIDCKDKMLIVDEVHNLRAHKLKTNSQGEEIVPAKFRAAMKCAMQAHKRLLLTGTPVVNDINDLIPIVSLLKGKDIQTELSKNYDTRYRQIMRYLSHRRTIVRERPRSDPNYPKVEEKFVRIPMSAEYEEKYEKAVTSQDVFKNPKTFFTGYRRAVNSIAGGYMSEKMNYIIKRLKRSSGNINKTVIYTNWIDYGVSSIKKILRENEIPFGVISGDTPKPQRIKIVEKYNSDQIKVLVITKAGSEGLNLLGTRIFVIMDPPWNPAGLDQIKARAIRFKSHIHLSEAKRKVKILKLVLVHRGKEIEEDNTGDAILYRIIKNKINMVTGVMFDLMMLQYVHDYNEEKTAVIKNRFFDENKAVHNNPKFEKFLNRLIELKATDMTSHEIRRDPKLLKYVKDLDIMGREHDYLYGHAIKEKYRDEQQRKAEHLKHLYV